jgi:hypothetical protein
MIDDNGQEFWYFTFGMDHKHPEDGSSLANCYVTIPGDYLKARERMVEVFGRNWCMQYQSLNDFDGTKWGKDYGVRELKI